LIGLEAGMMTTLRTPMLWSRPASVIRSPNVTDHILLWKGWSCKIPGRKSAAKMLLSLAWTRPGRPSRSIPGANPL